MRRDLQKKYRMQGFLQDQYMEWLPRPIRVDAPMYFENIGGDLIALGVLTVVWTIVFVAMENLPNQLWDRLKACFTRSVDGGSDVDDVVYKDERDSDVIAEEQRVEHLMKLD